MIIMLIDGIHFNFTCAAWQGSQPHSETWCYDHDRRHESVWMVPGLWRRFA